MTPFSDPILHLSKLGGGMKDSLIPLWVPTPATASSSGSPNTQGIIGSDRFRVIMKISALSLEKQSWDFAPFGTFVLK